MTWFTQRYLVLSATQLTTLQNALSEEQAHFLERIANIEIEPPPGNRVRIAVNNPASRRVELHIVAAHPALASMIFDSSTINPAWAVSSGP